MRDEFFKRLLSLLTTHMKKKNHGALVGAVFWAWGGEGRPKPLKGSSTRDVNAGLGTWHVGDSFTGDPPGEFQGAFSIYESDEPTIEALSKYRP